MEQRTVKFLAIFELDKIKTDKDLKGDNLRRAKEVEIYKYIAKTCWSSPIISWRFETNNDNLVVVEFTSPLESFELRRDATAKEEKEANEKTFNDLLNAAGV